MQYTAMINNRERERAIPLVEINLYSFLVKYKYIIHSH